MVDSRTATQRLEEGVAHHRAGELPAAIAAYRQVVTALPGDPSGHYLLGLALHQRGDHADAAVCWIRTLRIQPDQEEAYTGLLQLMLNPVDLDERIQRAARPVLARPPARLQRVQIEVTTWCNLKCAHCLRTIDLAEGTWVNRHLSRADFARIVSHLPPSNVICLQGVGESTMHPEILEIVAHAKASGKFKHITLNTNALARKADFYKELRDAGLTHLSVSVDSFDPAVAEACRAGTDVVKLRERLMQIAEVWEEEITVSIVLSRRNLEDVELTLSSLNEMGRFEVEIQPMIVYDAALADVGNQPYALDTVDQERVRTMAAGFGTRYPNLRIGLGGPLSPDFGAGVRCNRPFYSPYVTVDGYLTPCCTIEDPAVLGHTSVLNQSLAEAWRNPVVADWATHYAVASPSVCEGCCFHVA